MLIIAAKGILESLGAHNRLTRSQFQTYINQLTGEMSQEEYDKFLSVLVTSVKVGGVQSSLCPASNPPLSLCPADF